MKDRIDREIDISRLLSLYLSGSIEKEEQEQLDVWLQQDKAHQILLEELRKEENRNDRQKLINRIDMEQEWSRFQSSIAPKTISLQRRWLEVAKYAAVILLPLLIAGILLFQNYKQEQPIVQAKVEIEPGVKKAQLVLSNGKRIELADQELQIETLEKDVTIENRDQSLNYIASAKDKDVKKSELVYNHLLIGRGEEYQLVLSDGTKVWLNSETKLKYPTQFAANIREVELEGEAYFEVTKNKAAPFVVKTKQMDVEVLGTSFNVSAYADEETVKATLVEGKVRVAPNIGTATEAILKPNDQAVFSKLNNDVDVIQVDASMYASWTEGRFVFEEEPLEEIMRKLARWYDINVFFQNNEARESQFSGKLPRFEDCNVLFDMIEKTTNVKFTIKENKTVLVTTR